MAESQIQESLTGAGPGDLLTMPLWEHQREALDRAGNRFALFFDPGCGKSRTAIELYKRTWREASTTYWGSYAKALSVKGKVLIFAPLNVCRNWENEIAAYLGQTYRIFLVSGQSKAKKLKIIEEFQGCVEQKHLFLICNIECLRGKEYRALLAKCGASFVIVDESHNFKTPGSMQTKGLLEVMGVLKPNYLYLLTGTPAPQGEMDLWSTFTLLGKTNDTFFVWRKRYFEDKNERRRGTYNYWPEYVIRPAARILFQKLLSECSATAQKNLVLDLPPLLHTNIYAEMSAEQAKHYETMKEYLFAIDKDGNELNAANMLARTMRLQQILAGFLGEVPVRDNPRLAALDSAIEKTGHAQFVIWTIFTGTYKQIAERLEAKHISFGMLTGLEKPTERHEINMAFQRGEIRAIIGHPKVGGVGINLTASPYNIHYTRSYNLVDDMQSAARNYRGGSEIHERITRIDIITPDTIDEEITESLRQKKSVQDFILGLKEKHGR